MAERPHLPLGLLLLPVLREQVGGQLVYAG